MAKSLLDKSGLKYFWQQIKAILDKKADKDELPGFDIKTDTESEYILTLTDKDGTIETPNLKGSSGVYVGSDEEIPEGYYVQVNPDGQQTQILEVVNSIDEMVDIESLYILSSNGGIYRHIDKSGWTEINEGKNTDCEDRVENLENIAKTIINDLEIVKENLDNNSLPVYWDEYLTKKISIIKELQNSGGKDCFSFVVITDIHYPSNLAKISPIIAKRIMDECDIKYALVLGDVQTRGCHTTKDAVEYEFKKVEKMLAPIRDKILQTQGNHDGAWGTSVDDEGVTTYYIHNYSPDELFNHIYRHVGKNNDIHFDSTGTAYYIDDNANKVRYILLNTHCHDYELNNDGSIKYNTMRRFRFTQRQYDFLISDALSNVPDDYSIVVGGHVPIDSSYSTLFGGSAGDDVLMRKMLSSYNDRTSFSGTFEGTDEYDAVVVDADFSQAKGCVVGYFAGHTHSDTNSQLDGLNIITTRCDGNEENDEVLKSEKVAGTISEQSFDVFTINRRSKTIYATKIGAGSTDLTKATPDREIIYGETNIST